MLFATYLRGSQTDWGTGLALDGQGGLLVSGWTDSPDFPVVNAAQPVKDNNRSGFLARLSTADGQLLYSSFFGANRADEFHDVAVNAAGEIYLVGMTDSTDFPTLQPAPGGPEPDQLFLRRRLHRAPVGRTPTPSSTAPTWAAGWTTRPTASGSTQPAISTWPGSPSRTISPPPNPIQAARGGDFDVWAARISADGAHLDYSTYLGGSNTDRLGGIAVDPAGYATLAGTTNSSTFPTTPGAYQPAFGGGLCGTAGFGQRSCYDAFVTRLAPDGQQPGLQHLPGPQQG